MIADFKAASFTDQVLVIGVVIVVFFMVIMMLQLCNIAAIGRRLNKKMKKIVSLEKKARKKGRKVLQAKEDKTPVVPFFNPEGYVKAVKKEQPIIVNVNVPTANDPEAIADAVKTAVDLPAWTGYDDEEEVVDVAPVVVAEPVEEVVEEPATEVIEPVVEEVVEETAEPIVEEVAEEVVAEPVEEPVEEVAEPAVEEPVVEEVVEEVAEPIVEEVAEEVVAEPVVEEVAEPAVEEPAVEESSEDDDDDKSGKFAVIDTSVIIPKKSHDEKYAELDEDSKKYYDAIMAYAEGLEDVKRQSSVNADTIFYGRTCVVKTQIKQTKVVCSFSMLDAEMKRRLKSNKGAQEKFTSIRIVDDESLEAAKGCVDFCYKAAIDEKEYKHQMQLQKRRDARKAKKEAAATDAE